MAAILLGDLASREVFPGVAIHMLLVHDGWRAGENAQLCRRFRETLKDLAEDSLLFSPIGRDANACLALVERCRRTPEDHLLPLARARCVFESGDSDLGARLDEARRAILAEQGANESLAAKLSRTGADAEEAGVSSYLGMRGGLGDIERAARRLQLTKNLEDSAPTAAAVFSDAGAEPLAKAATMWRDLQGILRLVGDEGFDAADAGPKVKSLVASACGHEDFDSLNSVVAGTASRAAEEIALLDERA